MRNRSAIEFIGLWEQIHNPNFKGIEFDAFKNEAGSNSFTLKPQKWISATNAIDIIRNPADMRDLCPTDAFWKEVDKVMPDYGERKHGAGLDL